ncbi:IS66 family insertion sequence element accessory protein TnpB [Pseudomonas atacamensis]|uniref:IS66 family insertion sequence element accessory protein TnpB n=1 Tax=Pseudomonas atacamensis TaxID=2565368 RepID=A0AAQ2DEB2_9PSED|nr:IS66 family insertion sequence element accessory protein TnpB [Pseudomonas atacamensis]THF34514.1 IS66 family insertion sequence element accessory protein TnpB [Pseudomonas atacamensis]
MRIDSIWLATEPMDIRDGTETALARVIAVFGAAKPHCAYLFANRRATRMKVLVHDGFGIWLAAHRLNQARFYWPGIRHVPEMGHVILGWIGMANGAQTGTIGVQDSSNDYDCLILMMELVMA